MPTEATLRGSKHSLMTARVYNFSAGPAMLPEPVLHQVQQDMLALPGVGSSVLEISHRSAAFLEILERTRSDLKQLLAVPDNYHILFLQGGSRLQFSMVPMNLLRGRKSGAHYVVTGSWGEKAALEARREGTVHLAWDGKRTNYKRTPTSEEIQVLPDTSYVHFTSNETIQGIQFATTPQAGELPLICDASSDFLSRPLPVSDYGLIYACAQKNVGPAGLTVVVVREDLLERCSEDLPGYLNYRSHAEHQSLYNTPPTFAIYVTGLIVRWLLDEMGGLTQMDRHNREKSQLLYEVLDQCQGFYQGHAQRESRSLMNVTFNLPSDQLQEQFLSMAQQRKLCDLKGHRSVGGIRASVYNAMPREGVVALRDLMLEFYDHHST